MRGGIDGHFGRNGIGMAALTAVTLGLAGCGSSSLLRSSPLDVFSSSSKATTDNPAATATASASDSRYRLPRRQGAYRRRNVDDRE